MLGKHHSLKTRQKMSKSHKNMSPETRRKICEANKNPSLERRRKIGEGNKGKIYSLKTKRKMSEALIGKLNPNWQGGITPLNKSIKRNYKYRQWRSDVFTRDDFICQECGKRGGYLHAHHIKSFSSILQFYEITTLKQALKCEELWNINNGITLCEKCHKKIPNGGGKKC